MDARETAIQFAIADLNSGVEKSQRAACKKWGIPRSSLQERLNGSKPHAIAHSHQQRLTPEQEEFLVQWILGEDSRAQPPSHPRMREMATRILRMNGDIRPLGRRWIPQFLARNPRVASIIGRKIESARTIAANYNTINEWLELFERTRKMLGIPYENVRNFDETGVALGVCTNQQVIADARKKKAYNKSPESREWESVLECVSAVGKKLQCVVIFKGVHLQSTWFPSVNTPDWLYTTSMNGWTSNAIRLEWLRRIFIPNTSPSGSGHRLLILDGHGSHTPIDFMWECKENKIHLLYLPSHASHLLQPLDLAPCSVVKSSYRDAIRAFSALDDAAPVKKERFVTSYNLAREEGLSERVIRAGWKAAGLVPFNKKLVLNSSQITGRPSTPPPTDQGRALLETVLATTKSSQQLKRAQQALLGSENLSRNAREVLTKAAKAIALTNARAARLEAENQRLKYRLDSTKTTRVRKRVQIDPNERFANVEAIKAAMALVAAQEAENAAKNPEKEAEKAPKKLSSRVLDSMCTVYQL